MQSLRARSAGARNGAGAIHSKPQRRRLSLIARADAADDAAPLVAVVASRRSALTLASLCTLLLASSSSPSPAHADSTTTTKDPMSRYVKRKRKDPLASYVPALLLAREQLTASGAFFAEGDATSARALLRSGAFRGVRESVRAVGEYATEAGQPGGDLAAAFFRELEAFDGRMRAAEREQQQKEESGEGGGAAADSSSSSSSSNNNKGADEAAVAALDALVATVPPETVERARQVVAAVAGEGGGGGGAAAAGRAGGGGGDPALLEGLLAAE